MILAVDTNILLDILIPNTANLESSLTCLMAFNDHDELIICEAVFAELGSQFLSFRDLDAFLKDVGISLVSSNEAALFEASTAWSKFSTRKKELVICPACGKHQRINCISCNKPISYRQHILSDFLIGAHAKTQADKLITRDRGFYRTYFEGLHLLVP